MLKNKIVILVLTILLIAAGVFIFMRIRERGIPEVKAVEVATGQILNTISSSGIVRADSVNLGSARMAGRVEWVRVSEGDRVKAGQILVKLDGYDQAEKEYRRLKKLHRQGYISDMELERAKIAVDNASVVSPISGLVTEKTIIAGEAVSPGISVMTVVDIDNPWIEIQIDEVDIAAIKLGQRVRFSTDAFPEKEFFGKIIWINKKAELKKVGGRVRMDEEDLVFRAKVKFEDGKQILKPGMSVYAEVVVGKKEGVLVVPREAVALREGKRIVFKIKQGRADQTEVELGLKDAEKVEILKGLSLGEKVAVSSLDKLKDGGRVKIIK
jgi:HlyD family secretion protein